MKTAINRRDEHFERLEKERERAALAEENLKCAQSELTAISSDLRTSERVQKRSS